MAKVLVVGGAGYVGGATSAWLIDQGHEVHVLDDLSTGHRAFSLGSKFFLSKAGNTKRVKEILSAEKYDCVMHFAARNIVSESVRKPKEYFENNVEQTRALLEAMIDCGVNRFIFSSTCAIFGDPGNQTMHEGLEKKPANPYGETKLAAENLLKEFEKKGLHSVALRYFNAAGAEDKYRTGEWHEPETHLIPTLVRKGLKGETVQIFGDKYPTEDGTCIRDYIHVTDLAAAHESAMLRILKKPNGFEAFNIGSEKGFSVLEIIQAFQKVTGIKLKTEISAPRPGDPPRLVANSTLAKKELGYQVRFGIEEIIRSALVWEKKCSKMRKAVILDRDGTINFDPGYLSDPSQIELLPGVLDGLDKLSQAGFTLIVASNQSGVGRGLISIDKIPEINARLDELLSTRNVKIQHYSLCFHKPEENCACRKPNTKLLTDAAEVTGCNLNISYMVGDKATDIRVGRNAHCKKSVLVLTGEGKQHLTLLDPSEIDFIADDLNQAADWILAQEASSS